MHVKIMRNIVNSKLWSIILNYCEYFAYSCVFNTSHTVLRDMLNFNEKLVCITEHAISFKQRPGCNTEHTNFILM